MQIKKKMEFSYDTRELLMAREAFREAVERQGIQAAANEARFLIPLARRVKSDADRLYGSTIFRLLDWYHWCWKKDRVNT